MTNVTSSTGADLPPEIVEEDQPAGGLYEVRSLRWYEVLASPPHMRGVIALGFGVFLLAIIIFGLWVGAAGGFKDGFAQVFNLSLGVVGGIVASVVGFYFGTTTKNPS